MNDNDIELRLGALLEAAPVIASPDRLRRAVVRDRMRPVRLPGRAWHRPNGRAISALAGLAATFVLAGAMIVVVANRPAHPAASQGLAAGPFTPTGSLVQARQSHAAVRLSDGRVLIVGGSGPDGALSSAELYDPATASFNLTGSMVHARFDPTATLLPDGRVLVTGGGDAIDGGDDSSAELYDPATGKFSLTGSMAEARWDDTATLLADGHVLIAGGASGSSSSARALNSAELYDPATGTFSPTGSMIQARFLHQAVLLKDGRVLIVGNGLAADVVDEIYDPATAAFSRTGSMSQARMLDTATLLPDGRVLVAGGMPPDSLVSPVYTSAELWDPATGVFSPTGSMANGRHAQTATLLPDGRVLVAGGFVPDAWSGVYPTAAEFFDPATGKFSPAGSLAMPTANATATLLTDGRVLIAGGRGPVATPPMTAFAELYDPSAGPEVAPTTHGGFVATGSMVHARSEHAATRLADGRVLIVGGFNDAPLALAELYDPATGKFRVTGSMAQSRIDPVATLLSDGRVLVTGGVDGAGNPVAPAEVYDPATGSFTGTGSMVHPRTGYTATLLPDGRVLFAGGTPSQNSSQAIGTAELYDPGTGKFTATGSLGEARSAHSATLLPNGLVLIAGGDVGVAGSADSRVTSSAELYDPSAGTFRPTGSMAQARDYFTATLLSDGRVLVMGGAPAELYDPVTGKFGRAPAPSLGIYGHTATLLSDGRVLVAEDGRAAGTYQVYDPATGTASGTGSFIEPRSNYTATLLSDGRVLIAGGTIPVDTTGDYTPTAQAAAELYVP